MQAGHGPAPSDSTCGIVICHKNVKKTKYVNKKDFYFLFLLAVVLNIQILQICLNLTTKYFIRRFYSENGKGTKNAVALCILLVCYYDNLGCGRTTGNA
jgi:hypothetical protein